MHMLETLRAVPRVALLLACCGVLACGTDSVEDGSLDVTTGGDDAQTISSEEDVEVADPCIGLKPESEAAVYDDQCSEITQCTQMEPSGGACWCGFCGPKGAKIACLKVICETPGQ